MAAKFKNKYRIESTRLQHWDYGWNAAYFVTICTKDRICYFGEVIEGEMELSDTGKMANKIWKDIPKHFPFVKLVNHIVMPNHIHGILVIDKPNNEHAYTVDTRLIAYQPSIAYPPSIAYLPENNQKPGGITGYKNPMLHDNLSKIIRWYKGRTTFESRKLQTDFSWQSRFYDHIIRNQDSFHRIYEYVSNNPTNWAEDSLKPNHQP